MNKILILPLIVTIGFTYEGCGLTKKEALNNLSQSIYVNISNKFKKQEKLTLGNFEEYQKKIENESQQTTDLTLKNVKYYKKNNQWCANVNKQEITIVAKEDLKYLLNFKIDKLPKNFQQKEQQVTKILSKISFVKAILDNLTDYQIKKLTNLEKILNDLSNTSEVIFNTNIPNATIKISGISKNFKPSTSILLPSGKYSYTISAPNRCPKTGTFVAEKKKSILIDEKLKTYPIITFTSNQSNINLMVNGKYYKLNSPITIKQCKGDIVWSMKFENQIENGKIKLEEGLNKKINQDFISLLELEKLKNKITYYTNSEEVTINYGYSFNKHKPQWDNEKRLEIRKFNNYGIYKLGFGVLMGTQSEWKLNKMNEIEIGISGRIQISEIADKVFHIYKIPILPYFGVEGGWDMYQFGKEINKNNNYDFNKITSIFRGTIGITFLLHKQFGINVEYSKDLLEKRDNIISAGLILDF